jgi:folate-binding protein YgfZ
MDGNNSVMPQNHRAVALDDLGVLSVRGSDAWRFLQGQLSSDMGRLDREPSLLAGYHNPQGRVIAVLRVARAAPDHIYAILPRELVPIVLERLKRYVLRAKVTLADESGSLSVRGILAGAEGVPEAAPDGAALHLRIAGSPARWLALVPRSAVPAATPADEPDRRAWALLDIAQGLPQVYARTSEAFVAQMLNLDRIGAIDFDKGCYTGQEVVARAHYRGRVKRRMQRLCTRSPVPLAPGDDGMLADGRRFRVVDAVVLADGASEFLAVAPLDTAPASTSAEDEEMSATAQAPLAAQALPLPYPLTE